MIKKLLKGIIIFLGTLFISIAISSMMAIKLPITNIVAKQFTNDIPEGYDDCPTLKVIEEHRVSSGVWRPIVEQLVEEAKPQEKTQDELEQEYEYNFEVNSGEIKYIKVKAVINQKNHTYTLSDSGKYILVSVKKNVQGEYLKDSSGNYILDDTPWSYIELDSNENCILDEQTKYVTINKRTNQEDGVYIKTTAYYQRSENNIYYVISDDGDIELLVRLDSYEKDEEGNYILPDKIDIRNTDYYIEIDEDGKFDIDDNYYIKEIPNSDTSMWINFTGNVVLNGVDKTYQLTQTQIYCIEPGASVATTCNKVKHRGTLHTREEIKAYNGLWTYSKCSHASDPPGYRCNSTTYYDCQKEHYTESSTTYNGKSVKDLYDVAYLTSYRPQPGKDSLEGSETSWADAKQIAIWKSVLSLKGQNAIENRPFESEVLASANQLRTDSIHYQEYYENIMKSYDEYYNEETKKAEDEYYKKAAENASAEIGVKPVDITEQSNVQWNTNQETKLHTIGPFKIDYIYGRYGDIAFSGISNMYLVDNHGNQIKITNLVIPSRPSQENTKEISSDDGTVQYKPYSSDLSTVSYDPESPTFFSNYSEGYKIENQNAVDYWPYYKYYPEPGEEFYVEFNYIGDDVGSLKLHIDFQYLECKTEICIRDGYYWYVNQTEKHNYTPHYISTPFGPILIHMDPNCVRTSKVERLDSQSGVYIVSAERSLKHQEMEINIFDNPYMSARMKIGGFVFEDVPQTKETVANGRLDEGDVNLKNIEVALYEVGTNKLAKLTTLIEENPKATQNEINDQNDYTRRINPTLTDENGYYEFRGVSREKKYYIQFTYNGQTYTATDYLSNVSSSTIAKMVSKGKYDGATRNEDWKTTSKGTEITKERNNYDEDFASIESSPNNYQTSNSLKISQYLTRTDEGILCNETFSNYELAGFTLNNEGKYEYNSNKQLIDTYLKVDKNGAIIDTSTSDNPEFKEGIINEEIRYYIKKNRKYPTNLKTQIYQSIAGNNGETWKKLQFIEDCKISSYSKSQSASKTSEYDVYPVYNQFTTFVASGNRYPDNSYKNGTYSDKASTYTDKIMKATGSGVMSQYRTFTKVLDSDKYLQTGEEVYQSIYIYHNYMKSLTNVTYKNIYAGQLQINLGLWKRPQYDVALKKDVYKATLEVNGKIEVYGYDKREEESKAKKDSLWEIDARVRDYINYYGDTYSRELYNSDILFDSQAKTGVTDKEMLNAYITYKITIRNQSQNILAQIDEIVDYYDKTYTFMPNMSWTMYDQVKITNQEFYDIMVAKDKNVSGSKFRDVTLGSNYNWKEGQYDENTKFIDEFARENYQTLYVNGLQNHKMQVGETAYIYLTFKVNGSGKGLAIESNNTEPGKQNIAEINGYSTFYADNTKLPNNIRKDSDDVAGLIDIDSNPGNFTTDDLKNKSNGRYEHNFEDDADRAKGINVYVDDSLVREINGTVWEDKRNTVAPTTDGRTTDAIIGNGVRDNGEALLEGIRVEIHEVIDGKTSEEIAKICVYNQTRNEWVWVPAAMETTKYEMTGTGSKASINTEDISNNAKLGYIFRNLFPGNYIIRFIYGGEYNATYNGQEFKSTTYQVGITQDGNKNNGYTEEHTKYEEYTNYDTQNQTATYGYNIYKADSNLDSSKNKINVSDAKDIYSNTDYEKQYLQKNSSLKLANRTDVNSYSSNNYQGVTNSLAQTLSENNQPNSNTQMRAETGVIMAEFEYNRTNTDGFNNNSNNSNFYLEGNDKNTQYTLNDIDFGLVERPKAGLELSKKVNNVKITLANNNILFDAKESMNNLLWNVAGEYNINSLKNSISSVEGKNNNIHNEYTASEIAKYREEVNSIVLHKEKGLIQVTMDEELMHGATIQITYDFKVTNVGEVDYNETTFYYTGKVANPNTIVRTSAGNVIDYVANNLQFRKDSNKEEWKWNAITTQEINHNGYVNSEVAGILKNYNTIIVTTALNEKLIPLTESTKEGTTLYAQTYDTTQLVLTQLITAENKNDDLTYDNASEIVKISNDVGRRMAFSVQGNLNPTIDFTKVNSSMEIDSCIAERVVILPPFGDLHIYLYIGLGAVIAILLGTSIVLIKKKVLK